MKVVIETLGCKVNSYESELIKEQFKLNKDEIITNKEEADVIVINTCSVTNQADAKSRKVIRQARRANENAVLVVCGCSAENNKESLLDLDVDILIGNKDKSKIVLLVSDFLKNKKQIVKFYDLRSVEFENMEINNFDGHTRGFVKIQDGCNNFCSYCIIPFTRGHIRSKDIDVALREINCLANNGYQEIVLTGIDTGSYGEDKDYDLTDLIKRVSVNDNLKRIRISSIETSQITDKFIEEFKNNEKICNQIHIPIQSACDKILKAMNRKYTVSEYIEKINKLRSVREDVNITTDLVVGFPEETNEDFKITKNNLIKIGFSKIHTFPYSKRHGTKASTMKQVNDSIKRKRTDEILELSNKLEHEYYKKFIGKTLSVLVEDEISGFTSNYIKVILDKKVHSNTFVDVKITEVDGLTVKGTIL